MMRIRLGLTDEERADDDREPFRNRREELAWNNGYAAGLAAASVPREPTLAMENAGYHVPITGHGRGPDTPHRYFGAIWRAMHDAATGAKP